MTHSSTFLHIPPLVPSKVQKQQSGVLNVWRVNNLDMLHKSMSYGPADTCRGLGPVAIGYRNTRTHQHRGLVAIVYGNARNDEVMDA